MITIIIRWNALRPLSIEYLTSRHKSQVCPYAELNISYLYLGTYMNDFFFSLNRHRHDINRYKRFLDIWYYDGFAKYSMYCFTGFILRPRYVSAIIITANYIRGNEGELSSLNQYLRNTIQYSPLRTLNINKE